MISGMPGHEVEVDLFDFPTITAAKVYATIVRQNVGTMKALDVKSVRRTDKMVTVVHTVGDKFDDGFLLGLAIGLGHR